MVTDNPLSWMYFPTALLLGGLHALEPGHAKALTAAYLIGIKGTKRDAFFLGLSVALTHSIVVIGISVAALWLGRETFTQDVTHYLQIGSGIIVILLGAWLLLKRFRQMRRAKQREASGEHDHHHHGAEAYFAGANFKGVIEIIETANGERMKLRGGAEFTGAQVHVFINRPNGMEVLELKQTSLLKNEFISDRAPEEPHEFSADIKIQKGSTRELIPFEIHEHDHTHDHALMSDDEHARAHAADLPDYVKTGERPTAGQIITFGAAGGMIPCPASITVMLLALSIGQFASGLLAVAGFSIGLAITLVGIGLIVVSGISKLNGSGRFFWFSKHAPMLSALVVMLSGVAALVFAH